MPAVFTTQRPVANLSCLQCQQHKRKCDKQQPCQMCIRRGYECTAVARHRLPRGRHSAKAVPVSDREISTDRNARHVGVATATASRSHNRINSLNDNSVIGNQTTPCLEVLGVCDTLMGLAAGNANSTARLEPPSEASNLCCSAEVPNKDTDISREDVILTLPSKAVTYAILDLYIHRIDPLLKVCHAPSLRLLLLSNAELSPAEAALRSAVCWAVVCILTVQECNEVFAADKEHLQKSFRTSTETLLARAQLSTTKSLIALQAFVIYLIGLRTVEGWYPVWTLIPLATRIGQLHGLNMPMEGSSQFHEEIRGRLWFSIAVLEVQAGLDGGVFSTCTISAFLGRPPLHLDDSDISPTQKTRATEKTCFTDMTFASMSYSVLSCLHGLLHIPRDIHGRPTVIQQWSDRYALVEECEKQLRRRYLELCRETDDFHTFTETVGEDMLLTLHLLARRPMSRLLLSGTPPPDKWNVLDLAATVIERRHQKFNNKNFQPWRWFAWTKWHALAVLIAELCKDVDESEFDRAWTRAEAEYLKYMKSAPDGAIRNAMERLMLKARRYKGSLIRRSHADLPTCSYGVGDTGRVENDTGLLPSPATDSNPPVAFDSPNLSSWVDWDAFIVDIEALNQLQTLDEMI